MQRKQERSKASHVEGERAELQMSLELEFAAMRVNLRSRIGDTCMGTPALSNVALSTYLSVHESHGFMSLRAKPWF